MKKKKKTSPKAHKLTLSFPTRITQDHSLRSFNEAHVRVLLWLWIAHSQDLPASHRIKFVRNERCVDSNLRGAATWEQRGLVLFFLFFLSSFLSSMDFPSFSFCNFLAMIG
jgi:hypothetical protein